jgi:hypothetical protein
MQKIKFRIEDSCYDGHSEGFITIDKTGIGIHIDGFATMDETDDVAEIIMLIMCDNVPFLYMWDDIQEEDPQEFDFELAQTSRRDDNE